MMKERKLHESMVGGGEIPPGLSEEGIQFLLELDGSGQPEITDPLRIQFKRVGGYLFKVHSAMQWLDFHTPSVRITRDNQQEFRKTRFIVMRVLCPIVYPGMPITEAWENNMVSLHQRIKSFRGIFHGLVDGRKLLPEDVSMIPQSIEFMSGLQTQYPVLEKQFNQTFNSKK